MTQLSCPIASSTYIPNITPADLETFHKSHFSTTSVDHFSTNFLGPAPDDEVQEEEEYDGLGYYPDGVKRTLTDEQIAMFRHSEIQALLKERRHAEENRVTPPACEDSEEPEAEEGEVVEEQDVPAAQLERRLPTSNAKIPKASKGTTKRHQAEQRKRGVCKQHTKPDLRKRTWDKVDCGLESLEYGDEDAASVAMPAAPQRRRISYDDV